MCSTDGRGSRAVVGRRASGRGGRSSGSGRSGQGRSPFSCFSFCFSSPSRKNRFSLLEERKWRTGREWKSHFKVVRSSLGCVMRDTDYKELHQLKKKKN